MTMNSWGHHCLPTHPISISSMQYHIFCHKLDSTQGWNGCAESIIVRSIILQDYKTLCVHITWIWQHGRDNLGLHVSSNTPYALNEISQIPPKMGQHAGVGWVWCRYDSQIHNNARSWNPLFVYNINMAIWPASSGTTAATQCTPYPNVNSHDLAIDGETLGVDGHTSPIIDIRWCNILYIGPIWMIQYHYMVLGSW